MQRWYLQSMRHHRTLIALSQASGHSAVVMTIQCFGPRLSMRVDPHQAPSQPFAQYESVGLVPFTV